MPTISDTVTTPDGSCDITFATPAEAHTGPWPGVVMYPDAGGRRQAFTDMATRLAGYGYAVLVPDVYYRDAGWAPFDMANVFGDADERARLFAMMRKVTPEVMARDAVAFFDYLDSHPDVTGSAFGTTGYCMGGRTSMVVAGRVPDRVAAAMSFHGGGLASDDRGSPHLLADQMRAAVYVAGAENDPSFTEEQSQTLDAALTEAGVEHTIEFYAAAHGFAVPDNAPYDLSAAHRHWAAMQDFFGAHLR